MYVIMNKKVLIVEDEIDIVSIYQVALDGAEFDILFAKNGKTGLETATKEKPDLIILDLLMPEMNGFTFLEKLRADENLKDTPVIVASNLGQSEDMDKAKQFGIKDYLTKDRFSPKDILDKIRKFI